MIKFFQDRTLKNCLVDIFSEWACLRAGIKSRTRRSPLDYF